MKKTICIILALVTAVGLVLPTLAGCSSKETAEVVLEEMAAPLAEGPDMEALDVPAGDEPEPEPLAAAEPAPAEEPAEEPVIEEEAAPAEEPIEEAAPAIEEAAPVEAELTEEPAAEPVEEPAPETVEESADEPAEDGIASISMDAPEIISEPAPAEEPEKATVTLDPAGGKFPAEYNQLMGATVTLGEGRVLPDVSAYKPSREGYRFLGWFKDQGVTDPNAAPIKAGDKVPDGTDTLYAGWAAIVTLDAEPGSFPTQVDGQTYTRTVDLKDGCLPSGTEVPIYNPDQPLENQTVEFDGWYTEQCKVTKTTSADGSHQTVSIVLNGDKVEPGAAVKPGTTLYAGYKVKEGIPEENLRQIVFYIDYNGVDDLFGPSMTVTRQYSSAEDGYKLLAKDLLVIGLNWIDDLDLDHITDQAGLQEYWGSKTFNGYTFIGFASDPKSQTPDVWPGQTIANGQSIYAVWEKTDGTANSWTFDRTDPAAGPVESLHVEGLSGNWTSGSRTWSKHMEKGNSIAIKIVTSPARATFKALNWTVKDQGSKASVTIEYDAISGAPVTETLGDVKLTASGRELTVEYTADGKADASASVSIAVAVQAVNMDSSAVNSSGDPATVIFSHSTGTGVVTHEAVTCGDQTIRKYTCSVCGASYETKLTLQHYYDSRSERGWQITNPTCTENGTKQRKCLRCNEPNPDDNFVIPATDHQWITEEIDVCGYNGKVTKRTCSVCGAVELSADVTLAEHTWNDFRTTDVEATCGQDGSSSIHCSKCGAVKDVKIISHGGEHSWGQWDIVVEATSEHMGERERVCTVCGNSEVEGIPMLPATPAPTASAAPSAPGGGSGGAPAAPSGGGVPSAPSAPGGVPSAPSAPGGGFGGPSIGGGEPAPQKTPEPTATPAPTVKPTATPEPTPAPTATPKPTAEPKATAKPAETVTLANGLEQAANGKIYMKDENGENITGQQKADDGKLYYFSAADGHMLKGGLVNGGGGKKYLASSTGALLTGQQTTGGKLYYFSAKDGHMLKGGMVTGAAGKKFLASSNGVLKTGLQVVNGKQYYFSVKDGHMMRNGWVNGGNGVSYKLDSNGVVIATK